MSSEVSWPKWFITHIPNSVDLGDVPHSKDNRYFVEADAFGNYWLKLPVGYHPLNGKAREIADEAYMYHQHLNL